MKVHLVLLHHGIRASKHVYPHLAPAGYIFAVLILFQFVCVHLVLGFYEKSMQQSPPPTSYIAPADIPQIKKQATVALPVRLTIPSIHVDATIRRVGLMTNGSMGVPALPRDVAWYMLGPKPGEIGSATIAGHVDWWYGTTGVFEHLKLLKPGDIITVEDAAGGHTSFAVRTTRTYGQHEDASDVFRSYDGKGSFKSHHLRWCMGQRI